MAEHKALVAFDPNHMETFEEAAKQAISEVLGQVKSENRIPMYSTFSTRAIWLGCRPLVEVKIESRPPVDIAMTLDEFTKSGVENIVFRKPFDSTVTIANFLPKEEQHDRDH